MTSPKDFEKAIQERLESLGKTKKENLTIKKPPKPSEPTQNDPDSDEGVDKDKAVKKAKKAKEKRLNGYKNRARK